MNLPISINGTDYTDCFEYTARAESLRRVSGKNTGIAKDGSEIFDDLAVKYDLKCTTIPVQPARLRSLVNEFIAASTVSVRYYSFFRNQYVIQDMRVDGLDAVLAMLRNQGNDAIVANVTVQFRQK